MKVIFFSFASVSKVQLLVTGARSGVIKFLTFMLQGDGCRAAKCGDINPRRTLLSDTKLLSCSSTDFPGVKPSSSKTALEEETTAS